MSRFFALVLILLIQVTLGKKMSNIRGGKNHTAMMNVGTGPKNDAGVDRPVRMTNQTLDHMPFMENHTMDYHPVVNHTSMDYRPMENHTTMDHERLKVPLNHIHQDEHFFAGNHTAGGGRDDVPVMNSTGPFNTTRRGRRRSKFMAFVQNMFGN